MWEIKKMVGYTSMALDALRCNHLAPLGFKGLMWLVDTFRDHLETETTSGLELDLQVRARVSEREWETPGVTASENFFSLSLSEKNAYCLPELPRMLKCRLHHSWLTVLVLLCCWMLMFYCLSPKSNHLMLSCLLWWWKHNSHCK